MSERAKSNIWQQIVVLAAFSAVAQGCAQVPANNNSLFLRNEANPISSLDMTDVQTSYEVVASNASEVASSHLVAPADIGPFIPWPPPKSTSYYVYASSLMASYRNKTVSIFSEDLERALKAVGYDEISYFTAPGGFTLTTRLEKINEDGSRHGEIVSNSRGLGGIARNYIYRLLYNKSGKYRIIVFVLTGDNSPESMQEATYEDAKRWAKNGVKFIPDKIASTKINKDHKFYALIYEFSAKNGQSPKLVDDSSIPARVHIKSINLRPDHD